MKRCDDAPQGLLETQKGKPIMSFVVNRRQLLATAGFGLGGLMLPGGAAMAQTLLGLTGFTHNVASGEPGPD
jgi:alkaline phosphatase D